VILVKTCQRFHDRREACEDTWVAEMRRSGVKVYFVEGGHTENHIDNNTIMTTGGDEYDDNSLKLRAGLMALLFREPQAQRVFVADDDTFVHPARWLAFDPVAEFIGMNSAAISWVHGGAGFFLSRRCCQFYIDDANRRFSGDDVIASEIMTRHGVSLDSHPDLFSQWKDRVGADNRLITCHEVDADEMSMLYSETRGIE